MGLKATLVGAAAVTLLVGAALWWIRDDGEKDPSRGGVAIARDVVGSATIERVAATPDDLERVPVTEDGPNTAPRSATLTGRCVSPEGAPIAGARVAVVLGAKDEMPNAPAKSGDDGRFELTSPPLATERDVVLLARATGHANTMLRVNVVPGTTLVLGDVEMDPGGAIVGRVVDEKGEPVAAARVLLPDQQGRAYEFVDLAGIKEQYAQRAVTAAADGSFEFDGLPCGFFAVIAHGEDALFGHTDPIAVTPGARASTVVRVPRATDANRMRVIVREADGSPASDVHVLFDGDFHVGATSSGRIEFLKTDAAGAVGFLTSSEITYKIEARATDGREVWASDVHPSAATVELRLPAAHPIPLHIVDAITGGPVDRVNVFGSFAKQDFQVDTGRDSPRPVMFTPPDSEYLLTIQGFDHESKRDVGPFPANGPAEGITVRLEPCARVRGHVMRRGSPVANAHVFLQAVSRFFEQMTFGFGNRAAPPSAEGVTDADGAFDVPLLVPTVETGQMNLPRSWLVRAEAAGLAPAESALIADADIETATSMMIELTAGGALEGEIAVPAGRDPRGIVVAASRGDAFPRKVRTDEHGRWRLEHLTPGPWRVETRKDDAFDRTPHFWGAHAPPQWNATVSEGETTRVPLALGGAESCRIRGRFLLDGAAFPSLSVSLARWKDSSFLAARGSAIGQRLHDLRGYGERLADGRAGTDGSWELGADRAEQLVLRLTLSAGSNDGFFLECPVDLAPGVTTRDLDLKTGRVEGTIVGNKQRVGLFWFGPDQWVGAGARYSADADGKFTFEHVPAGVVTLGLCEFSGATSDLADVVIEPGKTTTVTLRGN